MHTWYLSFYAFHGFFVTDEKELCILGVGYVRSCLASIPFHVVDDQSRIYWDPCPRGILSSTWPITHLYLETFKCIDCGDNDSNCKVFLHPANMLSWGNLSFSGHELKQWVDFPDAAEKKYVQETRKYSGNSKKTQDKQYSSPISAQQLKQMVSQLMKWILNGRG